MNIFLVCDDAKYSKFNISNTEDKTNKPKVCLPKAALPNAWHHWDNRDVHREK